MFHSVVRKTFFCNCDFTVVFEKFRTEGLTLWSAFFLCLQLLRCVGKLYGSSTAWNCYRQRTDFTKYNRVGTVLKANTHFWSLPLHLRFAISFMLMNPTIEVKVVIGSSRANRRTKLKCSFLKILKLSIHRENFDKFWKLGTIEGKSVKMQLFSFWGTSCRYCGLLLRNGDV